jgi:hypothetical protein
VLCERLFGEPASTWYRKWMRTVPPGAPRALGSCCHLIYDAVYDSVHGVVYGIAYDISFGVECTA